jgi:hypothetical protein
MNLICHQAAQDSGATIMPVSGFVCGTTAQDCYQGLLKSTPPLVAPSYTANPTMAPLYQSLYVGGNEGLLSNNMPLTGVYAFTPSDLALIAQWIRNGSPNN